MKKNKLKEKLTGLSGSLSGAVGFLGSYQVCHNICLGIIAALSLFGIVVAGMPLLFLTKVAVPFWIAAVFLLLLATILYVKRRCLSKNLLLFNSGLIIAGAPTQLVGEFGRYFLVIGTITILSSLFLFIADKMQRGRG